MSKSRWKKQKQHDQIGEVFVRDSSGKKTDAALHDEILDNIAPEAERRQRQETRQRVAEEHGFPPDVLDELYGKDSRPTDAGKGSESRD